MWGFAYGLLDVLNSRFQVALHITQGESSGLQASYFGAYFIGPLTYSGWFLRKFGYRYTFILGLSIYCVGALMFWPSAVKRSFGGFCGAMFLAGSGLSTLEVSANPYIAVCGPPKWSEFRLELSQSVQAIGSVVAPILAAQVIFKNVGTDGRSLEAVQWVYLGIAGFVAILAVIFYFAPIPEITDSDMADQAEMTTGATGYVDKPLRKQYTLFWGTFAQFSYVGAQVGVAAYFINYFTQARPDLSVTEAHLQGANFYAIAQGLFAAGRFAAAGFMYFGGKPRLVLMVFQTMIMIFIAAAIGVNTGGATRPNWGGLSMLMIVLFFESCICKFPHAPPSAHSPPHNAFTNAVPSPHHLRTYSQRLGTPHQAWCVVLGVFGLRWSHHPSHPRQRRRQDWHQARHVHPPDLLRLCLVLPHLPQLHAQGRRTRRILRVACRRTARCD
jgi:FHS family L-fucose permease-like MFS transporter